MKKRIKVSLSRIIKKVESSQSLDDFKQRFPVSFRWVSTKHPESVQIIETYFTPEPVKKTAKRWSEKEVLELARTYSNRKSFKKENGGAYEFLRRSKKLDLLNPFFGFKPRIQWTEEKVIEIAAQFECKDKFRLAYHGAYRWMKRNGKLELLKFKLAYTRWNLETASDLARKFQSRRAFKRDHIGAFEYLFRNHKKELEQIFPKLRD